MTDWIAGDNQSAVLLNVVLLALWGVLPILLLVYCRQALVLRHFRPEFSLRKSETAELDRAAALYHGVRSRLEQIEARSRAGKEIWKVVFAQQPDVDRPNEDEREDLKAHARHLRATIGRLRDLPFRRLRRWIRSLSLHYALGGALVLHITLFAVLLFMFYLPGADSAARELTDPNGSKLIWYPLDARYFLANGIGTGCAALFAPALYLLRRVSLAREYALEFTVLKELVDRPTEESGDRGPADRIDDAPYTAPFAADTEVHCFTVLGVAQPATVEQVKAAYRTRIMQSHPDRLQDMSPAIRKFAEDETRRLNAAYQEALERLA